MPWTGFIPFSQGELPVRGGKRLAQRWEEFIEPGIGCRCENRNPG